MVRPGPRPKFLPSRRRGTWALGLGVLSIVAGVGVLVLNRADDGGTHDDSVDFTPAPGRVVPATDVANELKLAIEQLVAAPFVSIDSVGYVEGRRSDVASKIDVAAQTASSREVVTDGAEVGDPVGTAVIVSEYVIAGSSLYLRVLQPDQDPATPFQIVDAAGQNDKFLFGPYSFLGRIFDSLLPLSALIDQVPFGAERLEPRSIDGHMVQGVRATFRAAAVLAFLAANRLENVSADAIAGNSVFELWYDADGLRQLVATGVQFEDGEALDTSARVTYSVRDSIEITTPQNTA